MTPLLIATTVLLGLAALALGTASRLGATRALAALLGMNALLVGRAVAAGTFAWATSPAVVALSFAVFALSPPLLALGLRRAASHGPLRGGDARVALP